MPLQYVRQKFSPQPLQALDEAETPEAKIQVLAEIVRGLIDYLNVEHDRIGQAVNQAGGLRSTYRAITADSLVSVIDGTIGFDTTSGDVAATLPLAREYPGMQVCGVEVAGANAATFAPRGSDTINGSGSAYAVTSTPVWLQADAVNNDWVVIG